MIDPGVRQIVLDTETTGLSPDSGDRIIEVGMVELINLHPTGRNYQTYINPEREIPAEAIRVHGITDERVAAEPKFAEIVDDMLAFMEDAPLVIHNAPFDLGFLNAELARCDHGPLDRHVIVDTLVEARRRHPRQRNNLDALCRRYGVENSHRTLHGALLDAQILADLYVAMLGGHQTALGGLETDWGTPQAKVQTETSRATLPKPAVRGLIPIGSRLPADRAMHRPLATDDERSAHDALLSRMGAQRVWMDEPT